jgi:replicative DNA helicase
MGRRRRDDDDRVSLFPFLSIVICVIGILVVMLTSEAISKVGSSPDPEKVELTKQYQELQRKLTAAREEIDLLNEESAGRAMEAIVTREKAKEDNLKLSAEKRQELLTEDQRRTAELLAEIERLKKRIEDLAKEQESRKQLESELLSEVDQRQSPKPAALVVRPSGSGGGGKVRPYFVECTDTSLIIHEGEPSAPIRMEDAQNDPGLSEIVEKIKASENAMMVFLVRENAVGTYQAAKQIMVDAGCKNSKIPLLGLGKVDLRAFERLMRRKS